MSIANRSAPPTRTGEVIFEFSAIGNSVKVCAVDTATMREVSIIGPVKAGEDALKQAALRKLRYVLGGPRLVALDGGRGGTTA
jgi:hypothetical protein